MIKPFKFVNWEAGEKIQIDKPKEFIKLLYNEKFIFGLDNIKEYGVFKLNGWAYDLKPYLKKYLYKEYNQWFEVYAPNKTLLRKSTIGRIDKILEVV